MFSKYSETRVPPNYSGSRFKKADPYETETKAHRPSEYSAVKSSVSPTFEKSQPTEDPQIEDFAPSYEENEPTEEIEPTEVPQDETTSEAHPLGELLGKINKEDLLLICLIIFLSADKSLKNNDMIILLSLLLCV